MSNRTSSPPRAVRIAPAPPPWPASKPAPKQAPVAPARLQRRFSSDDSAAVLSAWATHATPYYTGVRRRAIAAITADLNRSLSPPGYTQKQVENKLGYLGRRYRQVRLALQAAGTDVAVLPPEKLAALTVRKFPLFLQVHAVVGDRFVEEEKEREKEREEKERGKESMLGKTDEDDADNEQSPPPEDLMSPLELVAGAPAEEGNASPEASSDRGGGGSGGEAGVDGSGGGGSGGGVGEKRAVGAVLGAGSPRRKRRGVDVAALSKVADDAALRGEQDLRRRELALRAEQMRFERLQAKLEEMRRLAKLLFEQGLREKGLDIVEEIREIVRGIGKVDGG